MLQYMKNNRKGFTLIELMIVSAIISILAAIAMPMFMNNRMRSFNSSAISDVVNLQKSEVAFFNDWRAFGSTQVGPNANVALGTPGVMIQGPGTPATVISGAADAQDMQIGLGNGVRVICDVDAAAVAFTLSAKHDSGNRAFAAESDTTAVFYCEDSPGITASGVPWAAANNPAASTGIDIIDNATACGGGNWRTK